MQPTAFLLHWWIDWGQAQTQLSQQWRVWLPESCLVSTSAEIQHCQMSPKEKLPKAKHYWGGGVSIFFHFSNTVTKIQYSNLWSTSTENISEDLRKPA